MRFVISFVCFLAYSPGFWKIVAKFANSPQLRFAAEFEVKEYGKSDIRQTGAITLFSNWWFHFLNSPVTPALSIKLTPESTFFYVDGTKLTVNIEAKCVKVFFGFMDLNEIILRSKWRLSPFLLLQVCVWANGWRGGIRFIWNSTSRPKKGSSKFPPASVGEKVVDYLFQSPIHVCHLSFLFSILNISTSLK